MSHSVSQLPDGTAIDALVPRHGDRTVSARVMSDPDIYRMELERIFDRTWVFVAHESEIPAEGDYVTRQIGEDPVIVARDVEGGISVLLNSCSHRGPRVCLAERGNAATFRCPYHGWMYENTGELIGVLGEKVIYGDRLDKSKLGLARARVETYHGLVFATWNPDEEPLADYLGPLRAYFEVIFGLTNAGMEVVGPPQRWVIPANWKLGADNFSTDNYHTSVAHETMKDAAPGITFDVAATAARVTNFTDPARGHSVAGFVELDASAPPPAHLDIAAQIAGIAPNLVPEIRAVLDDAAVARLVKTSAGAGNVWPNLSFIRSAFLSDTDAQFQPAVSIRLWQPRGPEETEALSWTLVHKDAPEEVKREAGRSMLRSFGSSGNFEQDDAEVWVNIQKGVRGVQGRRRKLLYVAEGSPDAGGSARFQVFDHQVTDDNQWHFYTRWRDMMESTPETSA